MPLLMQPNLLRNLCFLLTKNTKYRTFYRTHFVLISITCLSRYISLSCYRPALVFGNAVLYSFIHKSAAGRFFEYTANSAGGERLHREGETGDIILLNEI